MGNINFDLINACKKGDLDSVKKLLNHPEININFKKHNPLRVAIKNQHREIAKFLLHHKKIDTNYNKKTNMWASLNLDGRRIRFILNPFSLAMFELDFEMLDFFINKIGVEIKRTEYADLLKQLENEKITEYFKKIPSFVAFIATMGDGYQDLLPEDVKDVFLF